MNETILTMARSLCGAEEDDALLEALCSAAETAWNARLRAGVTAGDCGEAFLCAAAMTAAADYEAGRGDVESFTAGELSIKQRSGGGEALRQAAERLMEPYVSVRGFAFRGVRG